MQYHLFVLFAVHGRGRSNLLLHGCGTITLLYASVVNPHSRQVHMYCFLDAGISVHQKMNYRFSIFSKQ